MFWNREWDNTYQSMKNMTGAAVAKNGGTTFNQLKIPNSEFGHQFM